MANLKVNMSMTKNEMPEQDPVVRSGNFDEVALGYDAETAMKEAARCLDCKNAPCRSGCPVSVKIPRFLEKVREGDFDAAYEIIQGRGATWDGIAAAVNDLLRCIINDEKRILTVSTCNPKKNLAMSLPTIVGGNGVVRVLMPKLSAAESEALRASGRTIYRNYKSL